VDQAIKVVFRVKTYADITNVRFKLGLYNSDTMPSGDTIAPTKGVEFRYSTAIPDGGWVGVCGSGAAQTVSSTIAAIAANTTYILTMTSPVGGASVTFTVSDKQGTLLGTQTVSTNIPTGTSLGVNAGLATTTGVVQKAMGISLFYMEAY
jgi:hypothetical protein